MQDAFAYCAELVRAADRDRFLGTLFAPEPHRRALHALYAFDIELARVREAAREPLPGEMRLQWWSEALSGERSAEARANPVAAALFDVVKSHDLPPQRLNAMVEVRRFDIYDEPMASMADLKAYTRNTSTALIELAAQVLSGEQAAAAAEPAGIASGLVAVMRALPVHAARRQDYVPVEVLQRHGAEPRDLYSGRATAGLKSALAELRGVAREHLEAARTQLVHIPAAALPAFLPVSLVRPFLDRLDRSDPFAPADISPWRRQWLIWRAARAPARIAG